MSRTYWSWTLIVSADGYQHTIPGRSDTDVAGATPDTILPGILQALPDRFKDRNGQFRVVDFTATQIG